MQTAFRVGELHQVEPSLNRVTGPTGITRLEPKVMEVLVCLAEHAGHVVSKERLISSVWADTAVGDDVLTRAVSELRRLFGDDAKHPRVIETIPKGGYRLIARVTRLQTDLREPKAGARMLRARARRLLPVLAAVVVTGAVTAIWLSWRRATHLPTPSPPRVLQLTAFPGLERSPAFSPDGTQLAFSWNGEHENNFDIYVRLIGSPEVRRLTSDTGSDVSPAWSPDGLHIAFVREGGGPNAGGPTVRVISPLGGADRKLSDTIVQGPAAWLPESAPITWSPDGRFVAVSPQRHRSISADPGSIELIHASDGTSRPLTHASSPDRHVAPAFSPDGHRFGYAACAAGERVGAPACDVYVVDLGPDYMATGTPRRLTKQGLAIQGLAWTRDGESIVYDTAGRGPFHLWRVPADGKSPPARLEVAGIGSRKPTIAASRLAFERQLRTLGAYRLNTTGEPQPVLVSTVFDYQPDFSPDGRRLAFGSFRSGTAIDIWVAAATGSNAQQLTRGPGPRQIWPRWSPDGRYIAFESTGEGGRSDIWVIEADGGAPRRLTSDPSDENFPTWSRDGRWIYFSSDRAVQRDIWRVPAVGGPIERVTHAGSGLFAYESPDGRSILYQSTVGDSALVTQPLTGDPSRQVAPCVRAEAFTVTAAPMPAGAIYYSPCEDTADASIHRLDVATGHDRVVGRARTPFLVSDLAVSPDGKTILVHRYTEAADLMLIENFR